MIILNSPEKQGKNEKKERNRMISISNQFRFTREGIIGVFNSKLVLEFYRMRFCEITQVINICLLCIDRLVSLNELG